MKRILSFALALTLVSFSALVVTPGAPANAQSAGTTVRVSVTPAGTDGDNMSLEPSISADGRYVAFTSMAGNLVEGDYDGMEDVFLRDRETGETTHISVAKSSFGVDECSSPALSADGNYLAYSCVSYTSGRHRLFVWERGTVTSTEIPLALSGTGGSTEPNPSIANDGLYVAFESKDGPVAGDPPGTHVYVRDRANGLTTRVSVGIEGSAPQGDSRSPSISGDGRYVAFESVASNLVAGDTNGKVDVFVRDRIGGETWRLSVATDGAQATDHSGTPAISADGRYVAFSSLASNLVEGDSLWTEDVFVHDRSTGETTRVSVATDGGQADGPSYMKGSISADGRYVAFASSASNLIDGDTNGKLDTFVRDRTGGETWRVSVATNGAQANGGSDSPAISANGGYLAFVSAADNLVSDDIKGETDVFVRSFAPPDTTPPTIAVVAPAEDAVYILNTALSASYSCSDEQSGVASCLGPVASGANLDTGSVGNKSFTVNAADVAGNTKAVTIDYTVTYDIYQLYDQAKEKKAGSNVAVKLQIVDANGTNQSTAAIAVTATGISLVGDGNTSIQFEPPYAFRYDPGSAGYALNLSTKDLTPGTWELAVSVAGDPVLHSVQVTLR